jgi:hypothetical protein
LAHGSSPSTLYLMQETCKSYQSLQSHDLKTHSAMITESLSDLQRCTSHIPEGLSHTLYVDSEFTVSLHGGQKCPVFDEGTTHFFSFQFASQFSVPCHPIPPRDLSCSGSVQLQPS